MSTATPSKQDAVSHLRSTQQTEDANPTAFNLIEIKNVYGSIKFQQYDMAMGIIPLFIESDIAGVKPLDDSSDMNNSNEDVADYARVTCYHTNTNYHRLNFNHPSFHLLYNSIVTGNLDPTIIRPFYFVVHGIERNVPQSQDIEQDCHRFIPFKNVPLSDITEENSAYNQNAFARPFPQNLLYNHIFPFLYKVGFCKLKFNEDRKDFVDVWNQCLNDIDDALKQNVMIFGDYISKQYEVNGVAGIVGRKIEINDLELISNYVEFMKKFSTEWSLVRFSVIEGLHRTQALVNACMNANEGSKIEKLNVFLNSRQPMFVTHLEDLKGKNLEKHMDCFKALSLEKSKQPKIISSPSIDLFREISDLVDEQLEISKTDENNVFVVFKDGFNSVLKSAFPSRKSNKGKEANLQLLNTESNDDNDDSGTTPFINTINIFKASLQRSKSFYSIAVSWNGLMNVLNKCYVPILDHIMQKYIVSSAQPETAKIQTNSDITLMLCGNQIPSVVVKKYVDILQQAFVHQKTDKHCDLNYWCLTQKSSFPWSYGLFADTSKNKLDTFAKALYSCGIAESKSNFLACLERGCENSTQTSKRNSGIPLDVWLSCQIGLFYCINPKFKKKWNRCLNESISTQYSSHQYNFTSLSKQPRTFMDMDSISK